MLRKCYNGKIVFVTYEFFFQLEFFFLIVLKIPGSLRYKEMKLGMSEVLSSNFIFKNKSFLHMLKQFFFFFPFRYCFRNLEETIRVTVLVSLTKFYILMLHPFYVGKRFSWSHSLTWFKMMKVWKT
jgi:hypothetical protein